MTFQQVLLLLTQAVALMATPQQPSSITIAPQPLASTQCPVNCTIGGVPLSAISWFSMSITTTITAATTVRIFNKATNTTRTITQYNDLPSGYVLPDTNAGGTTQTTLTLSDYIANTKFSKVFAYPTVYTDYAWSVPWYGTLQTSTASGAAPFCTTFSGWELLPSHPSVYGTALQTTIKGHELGVNYGAMWFQLGFGSALPTAFPDMPVFHDCSTHYPPLPATQWRSASFVTEETDSTEDVAPTPTPPSPISVSLGSSLSPTTTQDVPSMPLPPPPVSPSSSVPPFITQSPSSMPPIQSDLPSLSFSDTKSPNISPPNPEQSLPAIQTPFSTIQGSIQSSSSAVSAITLSGTTITANPGGDYVVSSQTLDLSHPITIGTGSSRTIVSLTTNSACQTVVILDHSTINLVNSSQSTSGSYSSGIPNTTTTATGSTGFQPISSNTAVSLGTWQVQGFLVWAISIGILVYLI